MAKLTPAERRRIFLTGPKDVVGDLTTPGLVARRWPWTARLAARFSIVVLATMALGYLFALIAATPKMSAAPTVVIERLFPRVE